MKNKSYSKKSLTTTKFIATSVFGIILLMLGVLTPQVLAANFDNAVTNYDENTRTYTITNFFGLGDDLMNVTLITPLNVNVMRGEERKVAEIELDFYEGMTYGEVFGQIDLFDVKKGMIKLSSDNVQNRNIKYKQKVIKGYTTEYIQAEPICEEEQQGNNTRLVNCQENVIGSYQKEIVEWKAINPKTVFNDGEKITFGLFTEVYANEKVDFVPYIIGAYLDEWATWTENFNEGLLHWFRLDETTGTNAEDIINASGNGTLGGTTPETDWVTGIINNGIKTRGTDQKVTFPNLFTSAGDFTLSLWIKNNVAIAGGKNIIAQGNDGNTGYNLMWDSWNSDKICAQVATGGAGFAQWCLRNTSTSNTDWTHIVWVYDQGTTTSNFYVNGTLESVSATTSGPAYQAPVKDVVDTLIEGGWAMVIAVESDGNNGYWNGTTDEIGIWNRTLNQSEVTALYNGGLGLTYPPPTAPANMSVILTSPTNNSNSTNNTQEFIALLNSTLSFELINATLVLSYSNGTIYNNTVTNSLSGNGTFTSFNIPMEMNTFVWNVYGCAGNATVFTCEYASNNFTLNMVNATNISQYYNTITSEQALERFSVNVSTFGSLNVSTGTLYYNNTAYNISITKLGITGQNIFIGEVTFIIPQVSANVNLPFYWTFNLSNSETFTTTTVNQTVRDLGTLAVGTAACSAGFFEALNFSFKDEGNLSAITPDVNYNFAYGVANNTAFRIFGNASAVTTLRICVNASADTLEFGYGEIDYQESGFVRRRYYLFNGHEISNQTGEIYTLYDLHNSQATSFSLSVEDKFLNALSLKYVSTLKWYPQFNEYRIVEMVLTDNDGESVIKVTAEDVDYRLGVYYQNGSLIELIDPLRMVCLVDPCSFKISVDIGGIDYFSVYGIQSTLVYDETNNRFVFTYNDPSQDTNSMRLFVTRDLGFQEETICNTTSASYTGVILCPINENNTGLYRARVYRTASPEIALISLIKEIRTRLNNTIGLFASSLLAILLALIGTASPVAAIILMILSLIPAVIIGSITFTMFMAVGLLGGIVIHMLKKS